jgi:hypothetical protein
MPGAIELGANALSAAIESTAPAARWDDGEPAVRAIWTV